MGDIPLISLVALFFCIREQLLSDTLYKDFGNLYLDLVPGFLLLVSVIMAEVRDIASYICSNWTKVSLICHLVNRASSQHSSLKKKWIGLLRRCRCRLMKHWDEKIGQCSILEIGPSTATLLVPLRRLLHLLSNGTTCLRRWGQVGERFLWACNNKSTSRTILTWHIACDMVS